jgi:phage/plasmid-like protein (TIGR03299 family)
MAHEIYENNMVYSGETPWHGLGVKLDEGMTAQEIKENLPSLSPIVLTNLFAAPTDGSALVPVLDRKAVMRTKDNQVVGVVGTDFTPVQDTDLIDTLEALRVAGLAEFETAGILRFGSRFFVMMSIPDGMLKLKTPNGKTDLVCQYLGVSHGHDGTLKLQFTPTNVRIVCQNTVNMARAEAKKNGVSFTIKHTVNADARIKAAVEAYKQVIQYNKYFAEKAQQLIDTPFPAANLRTLGEKLFPVPKGREDDIPAGVLKSRYEITRLAIEGKGHESLGLVGTAWGAYQGVCEFLDWGRQTRGDKDKSELEIKSKMWEASQFSNIIIDKKIEALNLIEEIAA